MHIISNQMKYDESGLTCGFSEPVIHSYNKGHNQEQFSRILDDIKVSVYVLILKSITN